AATTRPATRPPGGSLAFPSATVPGARPGKSALTGHARAGHRQDHAVVRADRGARVRAPLGNRDEAGLHQLEVPEQAAHLREGAEPDPPEALEHLLLQGGSGRIAGVEQVVNEHEAA